MKDAIVQFVADIPHELATVFLSMIPVAELRFAIPWAILKYDMHPASAFIFSCIGNIGVQPYDNGFWRCDVSGCPWRKCIQA